MKRRTKKWSNRKKKKSMYNKANCPTCNRELQMRGTRVRCPVCRKKEKPA